MRDPQRHLPFALVLFLLLFAAATDLAIGAQPTVLVTLLAPTLWLGLYLLGGASETRPVERGSDVSRPH